MIEVKVPVGYKRTEFGLIPEDWDLTVMDNVILSCSSGATPYRGNSSFYKGNIRWITSGELNYSIVYDTIEKISKDAVEKTNLKVHPAGTFLMAITGLEAAGTRGSCGIVGRPSTTNQSCMAIYPNSRLNSKYLYHWYVYNGNELAFKYCQGTKQLSYTAGLVRKLPIYLPTSIKEQLAIANALTDTDNLIQSLEKLIAKKEAIKTGTMQQLLTGKTRLPEFATLEDGSTKGFKQTELGKIPEDWEIVQLQEIVNDNKIPSGLYKDKQNYGKGTPIVKLGDVFLNDVYDPKVVQKVEATEAEINRYKIKLGDLIIALASVKLEGVGKVMHITNLEGETIFDHNVGLIRTQDSVNSYFLSYVFKSSYIRHTIASKATQVGTTFLKSSTILQFNIALPSIEEQTAIATILSDMDAEIQALHDRLEKTKAIKQGMMQQLLTGKVRLV